MRNVVSAPLIISGRFATWMRVMLSCRSRSLISLSLGDVEMGGASVKAKNSWPLVKRPREQDTLLLSS
jgi:hypothetical protein